MKQFLLLTLIAVVTLSACSQEPLEDTQDSVKSGSKITLQLRLLESSIVQTKAQSAAETTLNNLWLFVFNSSGTLSQKFKARIIRNDVRTADFTIKEGVGLSFYVCANVSAAEEAKFDGLVNDIAKVADLKVITSDRSLLSAPGLPMWGELLNQTITAATTKIPMTLTRSCSRVDIVASGVADFAIIGIEKLLKTAGSGLIFPAGSLVAAGSTTDIVPTNKALSSIYLYENAIVAADETTAESKVTAVIIRCTYKGFDGYYKLRVKYNTPVKYDIGRNIIYSINIISVKAPGFATLAEAEANFPQNVDYSITVSDGDATDLVTSNGQYYLGVTNSEYVAYNNDAMGNELVVTVTHNAPSSITTGTVTASGTGLTLRTPTIPTSTQKQEIRVDMTNYFTIGTLTLRLGNLIKVVTITKKPAINMGGGLNSDYSAASYVQGDLDQDPTWFWFAKSASVAGETTRRVQNPSGGIWMRFISNIGTTNTPRTIGAYITSIGSKGRSRVFIKQENAVLQYVSGVPSAVTALNPTAFTVNVKTDLPGWYIEAYASDKQPIAITQGVKTGYPVRGTPTNCSVSVTVSNNPGAERYVYLYLCASEDPNMAILFATPLQGALANISIDQPSQSEIPLTGGNYNIRVTSNAPWNVNYTASNMTITPRSGSAGVTNVNIALAWNGSGNNRYKSAVFTATLDVGNTSTANWNGVQYEGDYIPTAILKSMGWPNPPKTGLQVAASGTDVPRLTWNPSFNHFGGTGLGLGAGKQNMSLLAGANHPAAKRCFDFGTGWFLPSKEELTIIYYYRSYLGASYTFQPEGYWSSSTCDGVKERSWVIYFENEKIYEEMGMWHFDYYVRCVREI